LFLQCITEWIFRHSPIFYTSHIMIGILASQWYLLKQQERASKEATTNAGPPPPQEYEDEDIEVVCTPAGSQ
jgi:hypothetical protein